MADDRAIDAVFNGGSQGGGLESLFTQALSPEQIASLMPAQDEGIPSAIGPTGHVKPHENLKAARDFFIRKGLDPVHATAIAANFGGESGGRTDARGDLSLPGGGSIGIGQWNRERLHGGSGYTGLLPFAKQMGANPYDLNTQLEYAWHELNGPERKALNALQQTRNLNDATTTFMNSYERPKVTFSQDRINYAHSLAGAGAPQGAPQGAQQEQGTQVIFPNGQTVTFPAGIDPNAEIPKLQQTQPELFQEPGSPAEPKEQPSTPTHGVGRAIGSGLVEGIGEGAKGFGRLTGSKEIEAFGDRTIRQAQGIYKPRTEEEIAHGNFFDKALGNIVEPVAHAVGQFGVPTAAGLVAGPAGTAIGAGAMALQGAGQLAHTAEEAGKPVSNLELAGRGALEGMLNYLHIPAWGPVGKALSSNLDSAALDTIKSIAEKEGPDAAKAYVTNWASTVLKSTASNALANAAGNVGSILNTRTMLGEDVASPEAIKEMGEGVKGAGYASLLFGPMHAMGVHGARQAQVEKINEGVAKAKFEAAQKAKEEIPEQVAPEEAQYADILARARAAQEQQQASAGAAGAPVGPSSSPLPTESAAAVPTGAEQGPIAEPTVRAKAPKAEEQAGAPAYYDTLGLHPQSFAYKALKNHYDINNPEHHQYINQVLNHAIKDPRLKMKNLDALTALRDQLTPPEQKIPVSEAPAPAPAPTPKAPEVKTEAPKAPKEPIAPEDFSGQRAALKAEQATAWENQNYDRWDAINKELDDLSIKQYESEKEQARAQQEPKTSTPDGGSRPQPIVREEGRDQAVGSKRVEPSRQREQAPEVKAEEKITPEVKAPEVKAPEVKAPEEPKTPDLSGYETVPKTKAAVQKRVKELEAKSKEFEDAGDFDSYDTAQKHINAHQSELRRQELERLQNKKPKTVAKKASAEEQKAADDAHEIAVAEHEAEIAKQAEDREVTKKEVAKEIPKETPLWARKPEEMTDAELEKIESSHMQARDKLRELENELDAHTKTENPKASKEEKKAHNARWRELKDQIANQDKVVTAISMLHEKTHPEHIKRISAKASDEAHKVQGVLREEAPKAERKKPKKLTAAERKALDREGLDADKGVAAEDDVDDFIAAVANIGKKKKEKKVEVKEAPVKVEAKETPAKVEEAPIKSYISEEEHPEWLKRELGKYQRVVYLDGDVALVKAYSETGNPVFTAVKKGEGQTLWDIEKYSGSHFTPEEKAQLIKAKQHWVASDNALHQLNPNGPFKEGETLAVSENVPKEIHNIVKEWKNMLGIGDRIYLATAEDAASSDMHGPFARVSSQGINPNEAGSKRRLPNGDFVIVYTPKGKISEMLETISHEMGHVLMDTSLGKAPKEIQDAIDKDFRDWLTSNKGKTAREQIESLRARAAGKGTDIQEGLMADRLSPYWSSKNEWFADQVSRWATTTAKPLTAVQKFYKKLGDALKRFFLANRKYLPTKNMHEWLDSLGEGALTPPEAPLREGPIDSVIEQARTKAEEAPDDAKFLRNKGVVVDRGPEAEAERERAGRDAEAAVQAVGRQSGVGRFFAKLRSKVVAHDAMIDYLTKDDPTLDPDNEVHESFKRNQAKQAGQFITHMLTTGYARRTAGGMLEHVRDARINAFNILKKANKLKGGLTAGDFENVIAIRAHGGHQDRYKALEAQIENRKADAELLSNYAKTFPKGSADRRAANEAAAEIRASILKDTAKLKARDGMSAHITPEMREAAERLYNEHEDLKDLVDAHDALMHKQVDLLRDTGVINAQTAKEFKKYNYAPLYMSLDELGERTEGPNILGMDARSLRNLKAKGTSTHAVNVLENLQRHVAYTTAMAMENNAKLGSLRSLENIGAARAFGTHVPPRTIDAVAVYENGKRKFYAVDDPYVFTAFKSMTQLPLPSFLTGSAKAFSKMALANPMYWYRQMVREPFMANMTSQTGLITPFHTAGNFFSLLLGGKDAQSRRLYNELRSQGITGSHEYLKNVQVQYTKGKPGKNPLRAGVDKWMQIHEYADAATKVAVYKKALKQAQKEGFTGDQARDVAMGKVREMVNFANRGSSETIRTINQITPFFGSMINGMDSFLRNATGTNMSTQQAARARKIFWTRAMAMSAMSAAYAYTLGTTSEEYQNAKPDDWSNFWLMPAPEEWGWKAGRMMKMASPFEVGTFFKFLPELMVRQMLGLDEGKDMSKIIKNQAWQNLAPPGLESFFLPQALKPLGEAAVGETISARESRPIESKGQENIAVQQRGRGKSWIADHISDALGVSPAKAQHVMQQYGAELYNAVDASANALSGLIGQKNGAAQLKDISEQIPFAKAFVTNPEKQDQASAYDAMSKTKEAKSTINYLAKRGSPELDKYLEGENITQAAGSPAAYRLQANLSKLSMAEAQLSNMDESEISDEDRETQLRYIRDAKQELLDAAEQLGLDLE